MTIACISDLHGILPTDLNYWKRIEECEILLICGDIVPLSIQFNNTASEKWLMEEFKPWAENLPVNKVYFIAGNHDAFMASKENKMKKMFPKYDKVTYVKNECIEHISDQDSKVYRIFGTPYCHLFGTWPFMCNDEMLNKKYKEIPENVDILFSHDSPKLGTVGTILQENNWNTGIDAGNEVLAKYILEKKPRYCFSGHIHSGNHNLEIIEGIQLANCSILNERYQLTHTPLIIKV